MDTIKKILVGIFVSMALSLMLVGTTSAGCGLTHPSLHVELIGSTDSQMLGETEYFFAVYAINDKDCTFCDPAEDLKVSFQVDKGEIVSTNKYSFDSCTVDASNTLATFYRGNVKEKESLMGYIWLKTPTSGSFTIAVDGIEVETDGGCIVNSNSITETYTIYSGLSEREYFAKLAEQRAKTLTQYKEMVHRVLSPGGGSWDEYTNRQIAEAMMLSIKFTVEVGQSANVNPTSANDAAKGMYAIFTDDIPFLGRALKTFEAILNVGTGLVEWFFTIHKYGWYINEDDYDELINLYYEEATAWRKNCDKTALERIFDDEHYILAQKYGCLIEDSTQGSSVAIENEAESIAALFSSIATFANTDAHKTIPLLRASVEAVCAESEFTPLDLCMVLDRSGSMDESMGDKTKMQGVKEAAKGVVNVLLPQDRVSIVPFSDTATANIDLTTNFNAVKTKINAINAEGNTSFGAGLEAALDQFKAHGNPDHNPAILFMSDGEHKTAPNPEAYVTQCKNKGIPIFTVGFATSESEVDVTKLKMMAEETGGEYHFVSKKFNLQNIFLRLQHKASGWESVAAYVGEVDEGETITAGTFYVDPAIDDLRVTLNWPGSNLDLELFDPSSRQVDFSASNVIYSGDTKPEYVIIKDPQSGYWTAKVYGKSIGSSEVFFVLVTKYVPPMGSPVHNVNTGEDFATIQNAIDDPDTQDGHTISVDPGTYTEHLVIDKPLKLMGDDKNTTIIEGIGSGNPYCVHVTADNVEISEFTIQHGMYGILLESSDSCTISENIIHDSNDGIHLTDSNNNVITNNILFNNIWELGPNGIILSSSDNNVITDNELVENGEGVSLHESNNNLIYHNNFVDSIFNQAYDSTCTNSWDNGPTEGGNYWSDHGCVGNPSDESQPYYINTDGVDHYPFQDPNGWLNGISDGNTITNTIGMEFVPIPPGEFEMGSPSDEEGRWSAEGPVHPVNIGKAFYMGRYEVTQKQWREIMDDNPSYFKGDDDLPVEQVSWYEVQEFIKKLNEKEGTDKYRLPSEAEWEYACRAGTTTRYSFGNSESKLGDYAWYGDNSKDKTHPVGQKKPNSWELYDLYGNVREWVQDSWHDNYNGAPTDGSAWESGDSTFRVDRGGSWYLIARSCRSAFRGRYVQSSHYRALGFRLLKEQ